VERLEMDHRPLRHADPERSLAEQTMRTLKMILGLVLIGLFFALYGLVILGIAIHILR
jgi:hypothetical protein